MTEVVAALIWDKDKFMICQRPAHKARGLLWEFVGGKVEPGETKEQALIRECQEELAVTLSIGDVFMDVVHEYLDLTVHLTLFNAAILEGSKAFSKDLMKKYNIPTAAYENFDDPEKALEYLRTEARFPIVLKADGLALGKGVLICQDLKEAEDGVKEIMEDKKFGNAGNTMVIEEFMTGREVSVLSFVDGKTIRTMTSAQDHKRAQDGDQGLNTGGMGTFSPSPFYTEEVDEFCRKYVYQPTVDAMAAEGRPFKGIIFFGLMLTADGPKVLEYNARFGDPEAQVVLPRMKNDIIEVMEACVDGKLDQIDLKFEDNAAVCVVLASDGYPEHYEKGKVITGFEKFARSILAQFSSA